MGIPILRTKLFAPTPAKGVLGRERLMQSLDRGLDVPFVLVAAPAGFGKTTAVARWIASRGLRAAWLSLDSTDREPARFWAYVVAALEELGGFDAREPSTISQASDPDIGALVDTLVNALSARPSEEAIVLVLDDLHTVDDAVAESLDRFIEYAPASVHVVATSRTDPRLSLSRYRARREIVEVRQDDLRFSLDEIREYLAGVLGSDLARAELRTLEQRTEGWAASVQLAALSMEGLEQAEYGRFVEAFAGDDRFVVDYLVDEVLAAQEPRVQRFLVATSILERLTAPLCAAVFAVASPGEAPPELLTLERAGLFLIPLDGRREWYRYHHLFADLLRARARREFDLRALFRQASAWCEEQQFFEEAIDYALRAKNIERAKAILEAHFPALIGRGEFSTIRRGVERLPRDLVHQSAPLCLAMAYVEHISTNLDAASTWIDRTERLTRESGDEEGAESRRAHIRLLRGFRAEAEQRIEEAKACYLEARDRFSALEQPYLECVAEQGLAGAYLAEEQLHQSERVARSAWRKGLDTGNLLVSSTAMNRLALCLIAQGRLSDADQACADHLEAVSGRPRGDQLLVDGYARITRAGLLIHQDDLPGAEQSLQGIERQARQVNSHTLMARALMERVRLALARGDTARARAASTELAGLFDADKVLILVQRMCEILAVRTDLAAGRIRSAVAWAEQVDGSAAFPTLTSIAQADVLIALGRFRDAVSSLQKAEDAAADRGAAGWALGAMLRRAVALHELRDGQAVEVGARALAEAARQQAVSAVLDLGPKMEELVARIHAGGSMGTKDVGGEAAAFVTRVFDGFARRSGGGTTLLSDREMEVLRLLDAGLSNKVVGQRLFVSEGTVKRHTHNIYKKLGVAQRAEALKKAKESGLI